MRHYAVTPSFWRGIWDEAKARPPIRRACDWQPYRPSLNDGAKCGDCVAYVDALRRMGVL